MLLDNRRFQPTSQQQQQQPQVHAGSSSSSSAGNNGSTGTSRPLGEDAADLLGSNGLVLKPAQDAVDQQQQQQQAESKYYSSI